MILRVGIPVPERPEEPDPVAFAEVDLTHRALLALPGPRVSGLAGLRVCLPDVVGEVALVDVPWDVPVVHLDELRCHADDDVVVRPVTPDDGSDPVDRCVARRCCLEAARRWSGAGVVVAVDLEVDDGSVAPLVTAAMVAGARVLMSSDASGTEMLREARRAADVTEALLVERAG